MDNHAVIVQGSRYPIYLSSKRAKSPSGYSRVSVTTTDSAQRQIAEIGPALSGDLAKRLDVIHLLQQIGISCPRHASARETANAIVKALLSGELACYHQQPKSAIQVCDNTASGKASAAPAHVSPGASNKKATQAQAKSTGAASNDTPSEKPITEQECRSDPVSMLTGEEILPLVDFTLAGSKPLVWRRLYRSSHADKQTALGNGWRHDFMLNLTEHYQPPPKVGPKKKGTYWLEYQDAHGAIHRFEKVKVGQSSYQLSSNLVLHYQNSTKHVLVTPNDQHITFIAGKSCWLLERMVNEKGQRLRFSYDADERLQQIEVNKKRGCMLFYDAQQRLSKVTAYVIDDNNKRQLLTPALAAYAYDDSGNLINATNQQGETEHYQYNAAHLLIKRTRASGFSHHFEWDAYAPSAKCIKQWGDNGHYHYTFDYDVDKGLTTSTDSRGNKEYFTHDEAGNLIQHTDANGHTRFYAYNQHGQKLYEIDPQGNKTRFEYNALGQLVGQVQPDGSTTRYAYNQLGQRVATILPSGHTVKRKYNATGLLLSETHADGRTTLFSYNDNGLLSQHVSAEGTLTKYVWSEHGELLAKQDTNNVIRYSFDALGRVNATIDSAGLITQFKYDANGRLAERMLFDEKQPEQKRCEQFTFDNAGRLLQYRNGNNQVTEQVFSGLKQPTRIIKPDGSSLDFGYDKERNLTSITRDDGNVYHIDYDANENPTRITGFDGRQIQFAYDSNNRVITQTDNNRTVHITRDVQGRIKSQKASIVNDNEIIHHQNFYRYDQYNQIIHAHNGQSTIKQQFDAGNRLVECQQLLSTHHTLVYTYDTFGRRSTLTLPDGCVIGYQYNESGELTQLNLLIASTGKQVTLASFKYDVNGQIIEQTMGNNTTLAQAFDVFKRLVSQELTHPDNTVYDVCHYQYDNDNQLISINEQVDTEQQSTQFDYDGIGQLTTEVRQLNSDLLHKVDYQWDSYGNPIAQITQDPTENTKESESIRLNTHTENDRLITQGDSDFTYDNCGNQTIENGKGINNYRTFNGFNQLIRFASDGQITEYEYDPLGRRTAKISEQGRTDYIWDHDQLLGEYHNGHYTWYINLPEQFYPIALFKPNTKPSTQQSSQQSNQLYFYHLDPLNTPRLLTNEQAQVVWQNTTNSFGYDDRSKDLSLHELNKAIEGEEITQPLRFQGQYFDEESGLHYNRYRYYSPKQQRFIHQDPIGIAGGINHYQYAPNPINWVDPFGLLCKEGRDTLSVMLDTVVSDVPGQGIDQATKDKIMQSAIDSAPITDVNGKVKVRKPDGKNNLSYNYNLMTMDEEAGTVTIRHNTGDKVKEVELTIEEFAGMHEFDGKVVNEALAAKGRIKEDKALPLIEAKKKEGTDQSYLLTEPEKEELQEHCELRDDALTERDSYDRGTDAYNKQIPKVNEQSAKIGEKAADKAINALYPGYQLIHPDELDSSDSRPGNFDMVYQNADGDVIIVEAKGGSSTLGKKDIGDRSYQQGTTKYAAAITEQMAGSKHASDRKAALAIRTAVQDGNQIQYLHAETPITKTLSGSTVSEVRLSEFDVDIKKLAG